MLLLTVAGAIVESAVSSPRHKRIRYQPRRCQDRAENNAITGITIGTDGRRPSNLVIGTHGGGDLPLLAGRTI